MTKNGNNLFNTLNGVLIIGLWCTLLTGIEGHREHKVHNIVLYPDKHSWCKTQTIKQVISYPGCTSVEIDNNVCVGACFSYSIPHTEPSDPGEVIVPYCDSCQPSETTWNHVTLQCDKNDPDTPPQLIKRVQIIQNCSCTSCDRDRYRNPKNGDNLDDAIGQQNNIPDLLNAIQIGNETHPYTTDQQSAEHHHQHYPHIATMDSDQSQKVKDLMNHKIITLLQNIQANNSQHDKEQLVDLLRMIDDPEHKISDKSITDFVESMNSENIELNIPRLRETLMQIENSKHYKEKQNGLIVDNNATASIKNMEQSIEPDGGEGSRVGMEHSHLKGSHIAMGLGNHILSLSNRNNDEPQLIKTDVNLTTAEIIRSTKSIEENLIDSNVEMHSAHKQQHHSHHHNNNFQHHREVEVTDEETINGGINNNGNNRDNNGNNNDDGVIIVHENQQDKSSITNPSSHPHIHHHHHHIQHHHNHHMGESLGHGHLARGPHGALVIEPDRIHEKLNVNPHELKPNHAGTLLSYHSHAATNLIQESKNSK